MDTFEKLASEGPVKGSDLLREDEILTEKDKEKPAPVQTGDSKEGKKKKPCANCTCGLADEQNKPADPTEAPKSNCGSCHLGDAFRCASCPSRGLPAFKPGEKVKIDLADDI